MDTTELQNQAIEIRDAENEGENTALRVGTMLLAIIDAFANIVDLDTLQQILEQYAGTTGSGQIHWRHARCVFLASMGADFDAVNGDGWEYTNHNGDIVFNPTSKNLRVVGETGTYFVAANVLYVHAHTSHAYKWDAAEQKMVEVTDSNLPAVITYKNTPAFSQVAIGESYVFQSQSSGPKIAIKISSSETYSFLPDPKKIYAFRDIRQAMLWKPSNQTWVSLTPRVINDLTTGGEGDALSAEQGKTLKALIDNMGIDVGSIIKDVTFSNGNLVFTFETSDGEKVVTVPLEIDMSGYVPITRKVNGKALSQDITIGQSDISGLTAALAALVPQTRTVNGKALSSNVTIGMSDIQGLVDAINNAGSGAVSVTTNQDGTFVIHVGSTDYTVNLNHTHENMAKLIVCEESDLPSTFDPATIYAITDSGETEIEKLIIRGMEFAGGGVPDTGEPMISSPSNGSTINLGTNDGSGVSKTITVKGKNLTGDLTVAVGTGLTISYGQALDASRVTIPMAQALLGAQVTIAYSGTGALDDGSLLISHGNDVLSSVVVVVVEAPEFLTAVKFTGTQWLKTAYHPNPSTNLVIDLQFEHTSNSDIAANSGNIWLGCVNNSVGAFYSNVGSEANQANELLYWFNAPYTSNTWTHRYSTDFYTRGIWEYKNNAVTFKGITTPTETKTTTQDGFLALCGNLSLASGTFSRHNLIIYSLKIYENNTLIHEYLPAKRGNKVGLFDSVTKSFATSETSDELVDIL